jgi:1-hydroxycarotenoid 3,4-desaturase
LGGLIGADGLRGLMRLPQIKPFSSMWSSLGKYFSDPRLRQLFGRYATYCGSSPFLAPATLMLVAHVERAGVWLVDGGMQRIAATLARLAVARGVELHCGNAVAQVLVRDGIARAVRLASGEVIEADAIVFNGDAAALADGLLGVQVADAVAPQTAQRSLSAVTWSMVAQTRGLPLLRHNVCFGADSASEFDDLFVRAVLPQDPTVYVCAQDRGASGEASVDGAERLLCLVNAPALAAGRTITPTEIQRCETRMFQVLARCGLTISTGSLPTVTTPADFAERFPGSLGALYGPASHGWKASFSRPGSRTQVAGLYLAGGTVHPGPGVPMAALSGRQAAASVIADRTRARRSTARSPGPAMPGGMSTP